MTNLESLTLQGNRLERLPQLAWNFSSLHSFSAGENRLSELPEWFGQTLSTLASLDLSNNNLRELPATFSSLEEIRYL